MRIAALYDVHGNLPALEAVLHAMGDVDLVVVGGDVVWGPWPTETMDLLRALPNVAFLLGNADRDVLERRDDGWKETHDWCADRLTDAHAAFLRAQPATIETDGTLFCHGSPRRDTDPITTGTPAERIATWCAGVDASTIVCGHTHGQFQRTVGRWNVVNAGSVGSPFGDLGAYWTILDGGISLECTPYDVHAAARRIVETGYPFGAPMAQAITTRTTAADAARLFDGAVSEDGA